MYCLNVLTLFLLFSFALSSNAPYYDLEKADEYFADFIKKYDKKYESIQEFRKRFEIFKENLQELNEWNLNHQEENGGFFISEDTDTYGKHSCVILLNMRNITHTIVQVKKESIINAPDHIDYRDQNLVTPVKVQTGCGACFIFAAIGNIEGVHAKQNPGDLLSLSEQQALDCYSENNCYGGLPENVIRDLTDTGCMSETDYPYVHKKQTCQADASKVKVKINDVKVYQISDIESLKGALYENGAPLAVTFYASKRFQGWKGSHVYTAGPNECTGDENINHSVLLIGYGTDAKSGKNYWLFKNSWGPEMNEHGYCRFDMANNCVFGLRHTCTAV